MRSKGYDIYKWELQWGPPRWPEGHQHLDADMAYYIRTRWNKPSEPPRSQAQVTAS